MSEHMLPLGEVVRALRKEIIDAARCGVSETVRFEVGPIDVELTIVARREGSPEGKIKFEVFGIGAEVGGGAKFSREQTQKVKLNLIPVQVLPDGTRGHVEINKVPQPNDNLAPAEEPLNRQPKT
jgi:hypothetical protein